LNAIMHQKLSFNHNFHLAGIQNSYFGYGHHLDKANISLHGGIQYMNYGEFESADIFGNRTGTFHASEYALTFGASRQLYERMTIGANLKFVGSQLESYRSFGLAGDVAAMFHDTSRQVTMTLLFRNIGTALSTYTPNQSVRLPFEVQAGISKRLKYLPFRFSVVYRYLNRWDIRYDDPDRQNLTIFLEESTTENVGQERLDNFFRHFVFSGEFLFGKADNFSLRFGYNHLRRQELSVTNFRSLAGFSAGVGFKVRRFKVDFGQNFYHLAGGMQHFSISTNLSEFGSGAL
ncbi:MAG: type IX secretion system protein PorQ, partial [Bacteroidota bacterium]